MRNSLCERADCFRINIVITEVADGGNLDLVLATVDRHIHRMDLVNIATALHRLAKLSAASSNNQARLRSHPVLTTVMGFAYAHLANLEVTTSPMCQALTNIAWAVATINVAHVPLLSLLLGLASNRVRWFKPFELCSLLWAFVKLGQCAESVMQRVNRMFGLVAENMRLRMDQFSLKDLLRVGWAFNATRSGHHSFLLCLADRMMRLVGQATCADIGRVAGVLSDAGIHQERIAHELARVATLRQGSFSPHDLQRLLCYFGDSNFFHEEFLLGTAVALQTMPLQPSQVVTTFEAMTRTMPQNPGTNAALVMLLPNFTPALVNLCPKRFLQIVRAAATCFGQQRCVGQLRPENHGEGLPSNPNFGRSTPDQIRAFFLAAQQVATFHLPAFSWHELAELVKAFIEAQVGVDTGAFQAVVQHVAQCVANVDTPTLLALLRSLLEVGSANCTVLAQPLFVEAMKRHENMPTHLLVALSDVCDSSLWLHHWPDGLSPEYLQNSIQAWGQIAPPQQSESTAGRLHENAVLGGLGTTTANGLDDMAAHPHSCQGSCQEQAGNCSLSRAGLNPERNADSSYLSDGQVVEDGSADVILWASTLGTGSNTISWSLLRL